MRQPGNIRHTLSQIYILCSEFYFLQIVLDPPASPVYLYIIIDFDVSIMMSF